ncbi:type II toxin-antitoxin system Phd/YefM family antitoxin [Desulfonatronum lacustre]|uniref:type II toxin-antitoxin system Phd/YefM family antitoxin n=1 Tax=Desulfonatronum lacustre TaxID=66849 RepID=UPI0004900E77|nr:type II toxin-antitoxin system prevent-host-death family antitoxin [Desulfonatronum lacustre]SMP44881.1 prevent-host-death family protein [Desulfonatronum zhilinae]
MKSMAVGELKTHFSEVIKAVQQGEEIVISYGKKREHLAVIIPYSKYKKKNRIELGTLRGKASYTIKDDFAMTSEELCGS